VRGTAKRLQFSTLFVQRENIEATRVQAQVNKELVKRSCRYFRETNFSNSGVDFAVILDGKIELL